MLNDSVSSVYLCQHMAWCRHQTTFEAFCSVVEAICIDLSRLYFQVLNPGGQTESTKPLSSTTQNASACQVTSEGHPSDHLVLVVHIEKKIARRPYYCTVQQSKYFNCNSRCFDLASTVVMESSNIFKSRQDKDCAKKLKFVSVNERTMHNQEPSVWHELESDPGVFTLLLDRMGVSGTQVDEIYDIDGEFPQGLVFGFIFLFRWSPSGQTRTSRRQAYHFNYVRDSSELEHVYFAHQVKENSCATHALLSIIMNCMSKMEVGDLLAQIYKETKTLSHHQRGVYFGQHAKLEQYHNSFVNRNVATNQNMPNRGSSVYNEIEAMTSGTSTVDQFHYISFVPINSRLYELDGLKPHPINHGNWNVDMGETWVDKFREVIRARVQTFDSEVCFNLLSVIPDKRTELRSKIQYLEANKENLMEITRQLVKKFHPSLEKADDEKLLNQLKELSPNSGTLMQKGFFDLQKKITWFKTYPDFLSSPLISNQEKQLYFEIKSSLESPGSELSDLTDTKSITSESCGNIFAKLEPYDLTGSSSGVTGSVNSHTTNDVTGSHSKDSRSKSSYDHAFSSHSSGVLNTNHKDKGVDNSAGNLSKMEQLYVDTSSANASKEGVGHFFLAAPRIHQLIDMIDKEVENCKVNLQEEVSRRQKYVVDQKRRSHNYQLFIQKYFAYALRYGVLEMEKGPNGVLSVKQKTVTCESEPNSPKGDSAVLSDKKDKENKDSVTVSNGVAKKHSGGSNAKQNSSLVGTASVRPAVSPLLSENRRKNKVPKRR